MPELLFWLMVVLLTGGVAQTAIGLVSWSKGGHKAVYGGLLFVVVPGFLLLRGVVPDNMRPLLLASTGVALGLLLVWRLRQKRNQPPGSRHRRIWQLVSLIRSYGRGAP